MQTRPLGHSGIDASVVALGTWATGGWMWGGTEAQAAVAAIHAAIDNGVTLIDTAPVYGFGEAEELLGTALEGRRDGVVLATKCGLVWHVQEGDEFFHSTSEAIAGEGRYEVYRCLRPSVIRYEVEQSLRRLKTDYIDLYQTHWQEHTTPIADTMATLLALKDEGKIRAIGVSNASPAQMDAYRAAGVIDTDQEKYSMLDRGAEASQLPYCAQHGIAFLAYSPLALGLLTGTITPDREFGPGDMRLRNARFQKAYLAQVNELLDRFRPIADGRGLTLAQLVIAWTFHQRGCSHVLVGARSVHHALQNAGAGSVQLTPDELSAMDAALAAHTPQE
jgi:aryl-alcohol dehydrogenase-like predicted oxidoreductase